MELFFSGKSNSEIYRYIVKRYAGGQISKEAMFTQMNKLRFEFKKRWNSSNYMKDRFLSKNKAWLSLSSFKIKSSLTPKIRVGRPSKSFLDSGRKTRKVKLRDLTQKYSPQELGLAAGCSLYSGGFRKAGKLVENIASDPTSIKNMDTTANHHDPEDSLYTPDEALAFLSHNGFTKAQYANIRMMSLQKGITMYPAYNHVRDAKSKFYPNGNVTINWLRV